MSIVIEENKDQFVNVRSNSMALPLVEAVPDDPEEATKNADPDSCRMLLNPRVTVSASSPLRHEFLKSEKPSQIDEDDLATRTMGGGLLGGDFDEKTFGGRTGGDGMTMDKDMYTRDVSPPESKPESSEKKHKSQLDDRLDDFNTFIQSATTPALMPPTDKLSSEARRRLKIELLQEYQKKNADYSYCPTVLTLEDCLEDIVDAVEFVRLKKSHETTKEMTKNMMGMASVGLVQVVNHFNLVGCDMTPWRDDFMYELREKCVYDDLLDEVIRTYRSKITIPTEYKLLLAIGTSFAKGVFSCKAQAKAEKDAREKMEAQKALREQMAQNEQARIMKQHLEAQQMQQQMQAYQQMQAAISSGPSMIAPPSPQTVPRQMYQRPISPPQRMTTSPMQMPTPSSGIPRGLFDGPKTSVEEIRASITDRIMDDESSIESVMSIPKEIPVTIDYTPDTGNVPDDVVTQHEVDDMTVTEPVPVAPKRRGRKPKNKNPETSESITLNLI